MMYGTLYIGGVPAGFIIRPARVASKESFKGCLGDAIINNKIINFAADEYGKNLRSCKKPVKYSNSLGSLTGMLFTYFLNIFLIETFVEYYNLINFSSSDSGNKPREIFTRIGCAQRKGTDAKEAYVNSTDYKETH